MQFCNLTTDHVNCGQLCLKKKTKHQTKNKQTQKSLTQQRLWDTSPHPTLEATSLEKHGGIWDWIWRICHRNPSRAFLGESPPAP